MKLTRPVNFDWLRPSEYWQRLQTATTDLETPFGVISAEALAFNAQNLLDRMPKHSTPKTIRVATKSIRVREIIQAIEALPGYRGALAFTLPEALWLAEWIPDVVVAYPSVDRSAYERLGRDDKLASRITVMIDDGAQLDLIDSAIPPAKRNEIRVCLELDAAWDVPLLGHTGAWRSPLHSVDQVRTLAETVVERKGFELVGLMGYEGQIAGTVDEPEGKPIYGALVRWMQSRSANEIAERRAKAVASVRELTALEFVNGGGTGSIESTGAEEAVTEVAAGSGLFGPHLFDHYSKFSPAPAASFALSVVRKPRPEMATILGGGWVASGPPGIDRLPKPVWPVGLKMVPREMAGEVQTPLTGASTLKIGDRVWFRHTKSGELAEHLNEIAIVEGERVVQMMPTYRGEGKAWL